MLVFSPFSFYRWWCLISDLSWYLWVNGEETKPAVVPMLWTSMNISDITHLFTVPLLCINGNELWNAALHHSSSCHHDSNNPHKSVLPQVKALLIFTISFLCVAAFPSWYVPLHKSCVSLFFKEGLLFPHLNNLASCLRYQHDAHGWVTSYCQR